MGLFSDIKAAHDFQAIKAGETRSLSISQIANLIVNLMDAQKNLSQDEFSEVYALYRELRKQKTKTNMDLEEYRKTAVALIQRFDAVAPYEKYSGGNELEHSLRREQPDEPD